MATIAEQVRRFPDLAIDALEVEDLEERDAAFAHAVYEQVLRRWLTLRHVLSGSLRMEFESVEPNALAALMGGAAQLILLDRVPVHAAVDTAVSWASARAGKRAGGLVNAVLRRVGEAVRDGERREEWTDQDDEILLSDGSARALAGLELPRDTLERLSVQASLPLALLRSWTRIDGVRGTRELALHTLVHPPTVVNTAHAVEALPESFAPHRLPGHHVFTGERAELREFLASRSDVWVQDPASSLGVTLARGLEPRVVVDACAGMGTKTRQLAAMFPSAEIVATDIDRVRARVLEGVFKGHDRVRVVAYDRLLDWAGGADLVLLDVPCSNTGVLARRLEARYRFSRSRVEELAGMQRQLIADSLRLVRGREGGDGAILYSTCSLEEEENEQQAAWASRWHSMEAVRMERRRPEGLPGDPATTFTDGSFGLLLR